jgi:hypothetical protein
MFHLESGTRGVIVNPDAAAQELEDQFTQHECKPLDASQNVVRIVREATEGK